MNAKGVIDEEATKAAEAAVCCCRDPHTETNPHPTSPAATPTIGAIPASRAVPRASEVEAQFEETVCGQLWQLAAEIFQPAEFERLVPRQRSVRSQAEAGEHTQGELIFRDPIAFTEAVSYEFLARGGKQARPFITLATYAALGEIGAPGQLGLVAIPDHVKRVALSIETFHKASLVHDDIEDEDEFRYGQPTLHRRYGIASAINVGDYLIGLGYRLVSRDAALLGAEVAAQLLDILAAAHQRLCEGQGAELFWRDALNKQLLPADALNIYALKTSPAFEAALLCGACLRGALGEFAEPFRQFAKHVGIAFQILNDLKDWSSDEANKKTVGGDLIGGRPTVLWAIALERLSPASQAELLALAGDGQLCDSARMERARELYRQGDVFSAARNLVLEQRAAAMAVADGLPEGAIQQLLKYIIETVLNRPHELQLELAASAGGLQPGASCSCLTAPDGGS